MLIAKHDAITFVPQLIALSQLCSACQKTILISATHPAATQLAGYCQFYQQLSDVLRFIDVAVVIGGDGTLLAVSRQIVLYGIPIIGINQGRLGFITDISSQDMLAILSDMLLAGLYTVDDRSLLQAQVIRNGELVNKALALNDIVLTRTSAGGMVEFELDSAGEFIQSQKSDGVIIATPTGSTAYSLAAGGPILAPNSQTILIVPLCSQALANRPLVISDSAKIKITLKKNSAVLNYDGQESYSLAVEDTILVHILATKLQLLHPIGYSYYHTLRTKLGWSQRLS